MPLKLFSLTDRYSENKSQKIIVLMNGVPKSGYLNDPKQT